MTSRELPVWLTPITLDGWPTSVMQLAEGVACSLGVPSAWRAAASDAGGEVRWHGSSIAESLHIVHITSADPAVSVGDWSASLMAMTDAPFVTDARIEEIDVLELEPAALDVCEVTCARFELDDASALFGVAAITAPDRRLMRYYVVSGRRGTDAWNVTLTFDTACMPGTADDIVDRNDHVRAGATLGVLVFG